MTEREMQKRLRKLGLRSWSFCWDEGPETAYAAASFLPADEDPNGQVMAWGEVAAQGRSAVPKAKAAAREMLVAFCEKCAGKTDA